MTQDDSGYEMKPVEKAAAGDSAAVPGAAGAGAAMPKPGERGWVPPVPVVEAAEGSAEVAADPDVEKNKGMAVLAYLCFIVPLVAAPNSKYARYHANQGLLLFICWCVAIVGNVALYILDRVVLERMKDIAVLHGFFWCGISVVEPALLVGALALTIMGIINAANGLRKPLPGVGHWELIK